MSVRDNNFEIENGALLAQLPHDQCERVFAAEFGDIGPEFLGFVDIYAGLAKVIPHHWTIVDLGCASAPQAYLFRNHAKYVGVDLPPSHYGREAAERFAAPNSVFYEMPIIEFCDQHAGAFEQDRTFAICSYVPPWFGDNRAKARATFQNVFTFYPAADPAMKYPF